MRSEEAWLLENRDEIDERIERAFAQFEQGEFFSAEQSWADMDKRKAPWLREHHG